MVDGDLGIEVVSIVLYLDYVVCGVGYVGDGFGECGWVGECVGISCLVGW